MSKVYTASRLSDGNKVFPAKVEINEHGVTVTIPGLFNNESADVSYEQLLAVKVDTPLVGYSRIYFNIFGRGNVSANGFTKAEVTEMRDLIQQYKSAAHRGYSTTGITVQPVIATAPIQPAPSQSESEEVKLRRMELESERLQHQAAERERVVQEDKEFIEGAKRYWKIWVPSLLLIVAFFVFSGKSKEKSKQEAAAYNIQLEKLNDSIQIMINEHADRDLALSKINRLVHPSHEQYEQKSGVLSTEYYDEYWNKVREERKRQVLEPSKESSAMPKGKRVKREGNRQAHQETSSIPEETPIEPEEHVQEIETVQ
ncbi:hypothetical protein WDZ92_12460 [Nostoc sp. NIES-2111]